MPLDSNGNFYPVFPGMPEFVTTCSGKLCSGEGPPSNDFGENGQGYFDKLNGAFYGKANDVWVLQQGVAGGSGETSVGSPEGVVTAPPGTSCVDVSNGEFYFKVEGVGNTGWFGPYVV